MTTSTGLPALTMPLTPFLVQGVVRCTLYQGRTTEEHVTRLVLAADSGSARAAFVEHFEKQSVAYDRSYFVTKAQVLDTLVANVEPSVDAPAAPAPADASSAPEAPSPTPVQEATLKLFARYRQILEGRDKTEEVPAGCGYKHLQWMVETALAFGHAWPEDKLSRWLGFVQGVMTMRGALAVDVERAVSRVLFHDAYSRSGLPIPESVAPLE